VASLGSIVLAALLLLTAWVLGIAALVLFLAERLGTVGALASVTAGLVVLALAVVALTQRHNKETAEQRATTRALWTATAANAASALLRRGPDARGEASPTGESGGGHRSAVLIVGGLLLILLAILFPSAKNAAGEPDSGPNPDDAT
jgi:hypothetical protein